jgi:hypothetical protein
MVQHTLITVNGTGVPDPFGPGFAADCGRGIGNLWNDLYAQFVGSNAANVWSWQPIGYPAAVAPMGPSVQAAVTEMLVQIDRRPGGTFGLAGYSQGSLAVNTLWRDHLLTGSHKHRRDDCIAIVNFGDPMRCPGIAYGNAYAGIPQPTKRNGYVTGGIAGPQDLTADQTPPWLLSFALDGDLYAASPQGVDPWNYPTVVGHDETMIFDLVQTTSAQSAVAIAMEMAQLAATPTKRLIPLIQAIWNGLTFLGKGTNAPHWLYDPAPAIDYLEKRGREIKPR